MVSARDCNHPDLFDGPEMELAPDGKDVADHLITGLGRW